MVRGIVHIAAIAILALSLTDCTPVKKPIRKNAPNSTRILLDKGRYEEVARRMSSRRWHEFTSRKGRVYLYSEAINNLIGRGDSRMKRKDYKGAGVSFRKAIDYYPRDASVSKKIKLSRRKLQDNIRICSNSLMEAGLMKYRAGQIEDAISIWKGIRLFDPGNSEAIKALDTATIQLENLRKLE